MNGFLTVKLPYYKLLNGMDITSDWMGLFM